MLIPHALLLGLLTFGAIASSAGNSSLAEGSLLAEGSALVVHVEAENGLVLESDSSDLAINPASLVKAATSLWALEKLGPEYRFDTHIGYTGRWDKAAGVIFGDLVVQGSGDPDFHIENAYLIATRLNQMGIREIQGNLLVNTTFWIGWEGGSEKREHNPQKRAKNMAARLRRALDPTLWWKSSLRTIQKFEKRRGLAAVHRPGVSISGNADLITQGTSVKPLLLHRSNPLLDILKRFNSYSNNDIERLGANLGSAEEMTRWLSVRWGKQGEGVSFASLSGLGSNRLSARQIVHLLNDLDASATGIGITLDEVLPVTGCDPGTGKNYPKLKNLLKGNLRAKTGSLRYTDGGVSVLAGIMDSTNGKLTFAVVKPNIGIHINNARAQQEQWVVDLLARSGGAQTKMCGKALPFSDANIDITVS